MTTSLKGENRIEQNIYFNIIYTTTILITLLLGPKAETMLVKQLCENQTKMYTWSIHFWDPYLNRVISKTAISIQYYKEDYVYKVSSLP